MSRLSLPYQLTPRCVVFDYGIYGRPRLSTMEQAATIEVLIDSWRRLPRRAQAIFEQGLVPRISIKDNHYRGAGAFFRNSFSWSINVIELPPITGPDARRREVQYRDWLLHEAYGHGMSLGQLGVGDDWLEYLALTHLPQPFGNDFALWLRMMSAGDDGLAAVRASWRSRLLAGDYRALLDVCVDGERQHYRSGGEHPPTMMAGSAMLLELGVIDRLPGRPLPHWSDRSVLRPYRRLGVGYCDPCWRDAWMDPELELPRYVYQDALLTSMRERCVDIALEQVVRALRRLDAAVSYYSLANPQEAMAEHLRVVADGRSRALGCERVLQLLRSAVVRTEVRLCASCGEPIYQGQASARDVMRHRICLRWRCIICLQRLAVGGSWLPYCSGVCRELAERINRRRGQVAHSPLNSTDNTCVWCQERVGVDCCNGHCPICLIKANGCHASMNECQGLRREILQVRRLRMVQTALGRELAVVA